MHSSFAKRCAILEGLRERTRLATAEFYQKPGVIPPPLAPLFIVKSVGDNNFQLLDRATGKIVAQRFGHNNATGHARALEAQAKKFSVKQFGRAMSVWALRIGAFLSVFAFFGSQVRSASMPQYNAAFFNPNIHSLQAELKRIHELLKTAFSYGLTKPHWRLKSLIFKALAAHYLDFIFPNTELTCSTPSKTDGIALSPEETSLKIICSNFSKTSLSPCRVLTAKSE